MHDHKLRSCASRSATDAYMLRESCERDILVHEIIVSVDILIARSNTIDRVGQIANKLRINERLYQNYT